MAGEAEAVELVKQARRRVGFAPGPVVKRESPALPKLRESQERLTRTVAEGMRRGVEEGFKKVDLEHQWRGAGGDTLRKRSTGGYGAGERELAQAHAAGVRAGDALVAGARARKAAATGAVPTGAVADAENARDRLRDVAKATPEYRHDGRLREATQLAEALATPPTRAPYVP